MRYKVINESESAHCCFKATVIDTDQKILDGDGNHMLSDGRFKYESVCETFSIEDAELICSSLNKD